MVRNFGERRKKKNQQQKKIKTKKSKKSSKNEVSTGEGIPQEQVTCREVAIYDPNINTQPQVQPKKKKKNTPKMPTYYRDHFYEPATSDDDSDDDYDGIHGFHNMLFDAMNMSFVSLEVGERHITVREIPLLPFLLSNIMGNR